MFRPMTPPDSPTLPSGESVTPFTITVDGRSIPARPGDSLAATLLMAAVVPLRYTPLSGRPRAPLCLMGVCFECLVTVNGQQNVQACMVQVRAGMQVQRQQSARTVGEPA